MRVCRPADCLSGIRHWTFTELLAKFKYFSYDLKVLFEQRRIWAWLWCCFESKHLLCNRATGNGPMALWCSYIHFRRIRSHFGHLNATTTFHTWWIFFELSKLHKIWMISLHVGLFSEANKALISYKSERLRWNCITGYTEMNIAVTILLWQSVTKSWGNFFPIFYTLYDFFFYNRLPFH